MAISEASAGLRSLAKLLQAHRDCWWVFNMVFSDITNKSGLVQDTSFLIWGDTLDHTTDYPLADVVRGINRWYHRVVSWILESQDEWDFDDILNSNYPIATANLVANQQDYSLPATAGVSNDRVLKIQRVEVTYDGTNWYKAEPFDIKEKGSAIGTATDINNDFDTSKPYYDMQFNSIFLYPIPTSNVAAGLKIWFLRRITDIFTASDTTQEPSFDEQFHRLLSMGGAYDYLLGNDHTKASSLRQEMEILKQELQKFYGRKQEDRVYQLKVSIDKNTYK